MDERHTYVLQQIHDKEAQILELGPLNRPIIDKSIFSHAATADIRSTEEVKALYDGSNDYLKATGIHVDVDSIVEIDYVINGTYLDTFGPEKKFDYIVASHVIEHIPDLLGWFQQAYDVLEDHGKLIIIYPDKRFSFDHYRNDSSFTQILQVHQGSEDTLNERVWDFCLNVADENDPAYWWTHLHSPEHLSLRPCDLVHLTPSRDDVHYWPFSPYGFLRFLLALELSGQSGYICVDFHDTNMNNQQFFVTLEKKPEGYSQEKAIAQLQHWINCSLENEERLADLISAKYEEQQQILEQYRAEVQRTAADILRKDKELDDFRKEVSANVSIINQQTSIAEKRGLQLTELQEVVAKQNEEILRQETVAGEYRSEIRKQTSDAEKREEQIAELQEVVAKQNEEILRQETVAGEYRSEIRKQTADAEKREEQIAELQEVVAKQNEEILRQETVAGEYRLEIQKQTADAEKREAQIVELQKHLIELNFEISKREAKIEQLLKGRDQQAAEIKSHLENEHQLTQDISKLEVALAQNREYAKVCCKEKDALLVSSAEYQIMLESMQDQLQQSMQSRDTMLSQAKQVEKQLAELRKHCSIVRSALDKKQKELDDILQSKYWRVGRKLRWISARIARRNSK